MVKSALIVVDMLNDFIDEKGALYCGQSARDIVPFVRLRLEAHRRAGSLVVFCRTHMQRTTGVRKVSSPLHRRHLGQPDHRRTGTPGGEQVLPKTRYSGFYGTDLEKILAALAPKRSKWWACAPPSV
jgi:nicotinamidase/pyrazinamidase